MLNSRLVFLRFRHAGRGSGCFFRVIGRLRFVQSSVRRLQLDENVKVATPALRQNCQKNTCGLCAHQEAWHSPFHAPVTDSRQNSSCSCRERSLLSSCNGPALRILDVNRNRQNSRKSVKTYLSFMQSSHRRAIHGMSRSLREPQYCIQSFVKSRKEGPQRATEKTRLTKTAFHCDGELDLGHARKEDVACVAPRPRPDRLGAWGAERRVQSRRRACELDEVVEVEVAEDLRMRATSVRQDPNKERILVYTRLASQISSNGSFPKRFAA